MMSDAEIGAAVGELERRIGSQLPRSYRDFLLAFRGDFYFPRGNSIEAGNQSSGDLVAPRSVGKFSERQPADWQIARSDPFPIAAADYYQYGYDAEGNILSDSVRYERKYVDSLIWLGAAGPYGHFLLNPAETTADGEWEAWLLVENLAGAVRYRSFAELMQALYFAELGVGKVFRGKRILEDRCALTLFDGPLPAYTMKRR